MPPTVGSAPLLARGGDDADDVNDGGPHYQASVVGDAARACRVARQLGVVVLVCRELATATLTGREQPCGPGEGPAVPSVPLTVGSAPLLGCAGDDVDYVNDGGPALQGSHGRGQSVGTLVAW